MFDGIPEAPSMTTLEPDQAADFLSNMILAAKDGNLKDWADTVSVEYAQQVHDTMQDLKVANEYYRLSSGGLAAAAHCFKRHAQKVDDPYEAIICGACAVGLVAFAVEGDEFLKQNATPQLKKVLDFVAELKKKSLLMQIPLLDAMANSMSQELGIPLEDARKELGLSPDGKSMLEAEEGEAEVPKKPAQGGWSTPSLEE